MGVVGVSWVVQEDGELKFGTQPLDATTIIPDEPNHRHQDVQHLGYFV